MEAAQALIGVDQRGIMNYSGVSTSVVGAMTASEALEQAEMNWEVGLHEAGYRKGDRFTSSKNGRLAIVREDTGEDFGYVTSKYHPIQNHEMFDWADNLVDQGGVYEAAFTMYGGKKVGLVMRFPEQILIGGEDPYNRTLLLVGAHDGTGSVTAAVNMVRIFCVNQLNLALRQAENVYRIRHRSNASAKLQAAREALEISFRYDEVFDEEMRKLMERSIDEENAKAVIKEVFEKNRFGSAETKADRVWDLAHDETIQSGLHGTKYSVLQGMVEWLDWDRKGKTAHSDLVGKLEGRLRKTAQDTYLALSGV